MSVFPVDKSGNPVPVMGVRYGSSQNQSQTTTAGTALALATPSKFVQVIRVMALDGDIYFRTGDSAVAAPTAADAAVLSGGWGDYPLPVGHTHIRFVARAGTPIARVELLD